MSHRTFKVSIIIDETVENFYIKHYVGKAVERTETFEKLLWNLHFVCLDEYQPIFQKFKNMVFQRNPSVNQPNLKVYWIGEFAVFLLFHNFIGRFRSELRRSLHMSHFQVLLSSRTLKTAKILK